MSDLFLITTYKAKPQMIERDEEWIQRIRNIERESEIRSIRRIEGEILD